MKTTKFFLIVAIFSIATLTYSQTNSEREKTPFSVKMSLSVAVQNPQLALVMHEQLNPGFLNENQGSRIYTASVKYRGTRYVIYGTKEEWETFFSVLPDDPTPEL